MSDTVRATEAWFRAHGLPYFVVAEQDEVDEALGRARLTAVVVGASLAAVAVAVGLGLWLGDASVGVVAATVVLALVMAGYAVVELSVWPILRWAVLRTLGSLRLLFPLVTRALPLLLLFTTFLFINAEVWQVTATMDGALLWLVVLVFSGLAVAFLLVRLPEEVDRVTAEVDGSRLVERCHGTPVADAAGDLDRARVEVAPVRGLPRANLLLVLLLAQTAQVLLLAVSVFVFFVGFGRLAMTPAVIESWVGEPPHPLGSSLVGTVELFQVSVFLAAFAGLYFTVYAVTDQIYREQFFTGVSDELERAIAVRTAYLELRRRADRLDSEPRLDSEERDTGC